MTTQERNEAWAVCERCDHIRESHKDQLGGICIGCPCSGFAPSGQYWDGVPGSRRKGGRA